MSKNKFHENDTALIINKREQLWEQQKKLLVEQNETLLLMIADKERKWEMEKAEMLQRNMELTNALEESERKAKAQHKALTERCEVLIAALETKYAEEKLLHSQRVLDSVTSERININVGGKVFSTCRETLTRNNFRLERWPIHSDGSSLISILPNLFLCDRFFLTVFRKLFRRSRSHLLLRYHGLHAHRAFRRGEPDRQAAAPSPRRVHLLSATVTDPQAELPMEL